MRGDEPQSHVLYLALGTNLGDRRANLLRALDLIGKRIGQVVRTSSFLQTEPWGFSSTNTFLNAACMVHTTLEPMQCLECTQQIEREMGRTQKSVHGVYADRVIDIDLLTYDDLHIVTPQLFKCQHLFFRLYAFCHQLSAHIMKHGYQIFNCNKTIMI